MGPQGSFEKGSYTVWLLIQSRSERDYHIMPRRYIRNFFRNTAIQHFSTFISTFDDDFNLIRSLKSDKIDIKNNEWLIYNVTVFEDNTSKKSDLLKFRSNHNKFWLCDYLIVI